MVVVQEQSSAVLGAIEQALAQHPAFGDSTYILGRLQLSLERRLSKISARFPIAGQLLDALEHADSGSLYRVIGDTVVRCAILHAHTQLETGAPYGLPLADCESVFSATIRRLQQGKYGTPLDDGSLRRLGPESYHGWLWSEDHPNDIFGRCFRYLLQQRYQALPIAPSDDEIAMLEKGVRLLQDLLPSLTSSALRHAHVVACVPDSGGWKNVASSSQIRIGGTIFLGRFMSSPWWVAEHLFHEAMHQKLYDFRHGHSLLELDIEQVYAPRVRVPWNSPRLNNANQWDAHRVFAAFHVYVHVALFALVAEQRASELEEAYGPISMIKSATALERAQYLGEQLREQCWEQLGLAGKGLADWLMSVLEFLNPSPPPKGAYVHLCLDLYEKEANQVVAALRESGSVPTSLPEDLTPLAKDEVEGTRRVLSAIDARQELHRFNTAVAQYSDEELGTRLPDLRRVIGKALMGASPDRYRLTDSGGHDELVRQMIENASQRLYSVLAGYPPAVADAKRRANELRFASSCHDGVGRLLAVLAGAVPSGGRVLEIGTGAGVGTAWITAGLGERTDVELVSVEVDTRLGDAARGWPWPAYVEIVTADALQALGVLGTFNLVFADAAPIKYGHIESVLRALRPGGLLVVDDLEVGLRTTEVQRAEKGDLRRSLLHHRELHAVEIEGLTGVILASKSMRPDGFVGSTAELSEVRSSR